MKGTANWPALRALPVLPRGRTRIEIARIVGRSDTRIWNVEQAALRKLRAVAVAGGLGHARRVG